VRVALVTGGNRGIGRAIAIGLAGDGCDIVLTYQRHADAAVDTMAAINTLGQVAVPMQVDLDDPASCAALAHAALDRFDGVDILVTSAGVDASGKSSVDMTRAEVDRHLRVHALSAFELCRLLVPSMRARGGGHVIVVSSAATFRWPANNAAYNMGKAALEAFAFGLAKEERAHGIHVHVVAPGLVDTDMGRRIARTHARAISDAGAIDRFGRVCEPKDVADVVRYLCSPAAAYLTGQKVAVDGGGARAVKEYRQDR
jgi:3-oxoacyl-[acyl-carrier protein] reductase